MGSFIGLTPSPFNAGTMTIEGFSVSVEFHVDMQCVKPCSHYVKPIVGVTGHITKISAGVQKTRELFIKQPLRDCFLLNPKYVRSVPFTIISTAIGPQMTCNNCYFIDADLTLQGVTTGHCHGWFEGDNRLYGRFMNEDQHALK